MQVLVARHELAERACGKERLGREQRPALVNVANPAPQPFSTGHHLDLRGGDALVRRVNFGANRGQLLVERLHQPRSGVGLASKQNHFVLQRPDPSLQLPRLGLKRIALIADSIELLPLCAQPRFRTLTPCGSRTHARQNYRQANPTRECCSRSFGYLRHGGRVPWCGERANLERH
jgi:hypothetical protein